MIFLKFGILYWFHSSVGRARDFLDIIQLVECCIWGADVLRSSRSIQTLIASNHGVVGFKSHWNHNIKIQQCGMSEVGIWGVPFNRVNCIKSFWSFRNVISSNLISKTSSCENLKGSSPFPATREEVIVGNDYIMKD